MIAEILLVTILMMLDPFVGASLMITVLTVACYKNSFKQLCYLAFIFGLVHDLENNLWLGISGLMIITVCLVVYVIKEQFALSQTWVVLVTAVMGELLYAIISRQEIKLSSLVIQSVMVVLMWKLAGIQKPKGGVYLRT